MSGLGEVKMHGRYLNSQPQSCSMTSRNLELFLFRRLQLWYSDCWNDIFVFWIAGHFIRSCWIWRLIVVQLPLLILIVIQGTIHAFSSPWTQSQITPNTVSAKLPEILILHDYCDTITLLLNRTVNSVPTRQGCNSFLPIIFTVTENDRDL